MQTKEKIMIGREVAEIVDANDLWDFWKRHPRLTTSKIIDYVDVSDIVKILYEETLKEKGDMDLIVRSWTVSKEVKKAIGEIEYHLDRIDRRHGRLIVKYLEPHRAQKTIYSMICHVISRDRGETCIRISEKDVDWAKKELEKQGKDVSPKAVEDFLYENKEHEPYLSWAERKRLGLI